MWILESSGSGLQGRRLWLRPGKKYLLGRTSAEAGQLLITHKTISRKHLTITVSPVDEGNAQNLASKSMLVLEDLNTSKGTFVGDMSIQNKKHVVDVPEMEFTMGKCPDVFRISWFPVVLTYSFTSREMRNDPLATLRAELEQLDIKFITEYNVKSTTHVVSKKRNTSKGLQALINGRYIVSNTFTDAIVQAATVAGGDESGQSPLEADFDGAWPDALQHLPPRGTESTQRPVDEYAPDDGRQRVFEGYTFVFYDKAQWENLLAPITNGRGKALFFEVDPHGTSVDDFVRYVKSVAGEKGLGSFEDGSEGRGVVVVRFVPAKGDNIQWYTDLTRSFSLRLDHRPIEQGEFLEAILAKNATMLRRPLEVEPEVQPEREAPPARPAQVAQSSNDRSSVSQETSQQDQPQPARKSRFRRPVLKRFKGFDDDDDDDDMPVTAAATGAQAAVPESNPSAASQEDGLFVSQRSGMAESQDEAPTTRRSQRKRGPPIAEEDDIMGDIAPAAAAAKRRRIELGEEPIVRNPIPAAQIQQQTKTSQRAKKTKKDIDVLEVARKTREEADARAKADNDDNAGPDDVDLAEIRRLTIVEEMPIRRPPRPGNGEENGTDERWDPRWNGRKNFKKFRARGEDARRPAQKIIVPLVEVKTKGFGIGDDYWLEDEGARRESQAKSQEQQKSGSSGGAKQKRQPQRRTVSSDSEADETGDVEVSLAITEREEQQNSSSRGVRSSRSQRTTNASQSTASRSQAAAPATRTVAGAKRPAQTAAAENPAKRARPTRRVAEVADSESDEEDGGFKFGRRR